MTAQSLIDSHQSAGRFFTPNGVKSFVRTQGSGEAVVCMHGVPASSFLYRKLLPELANVGLKGVAFDLPGLGLADRPSGFNYSFTGLGEWSLQAIDELHIDQFHLVVHDIGGPIGLEVLSTIPHRVRSLTLLNTMVLVDSFKKPWMMQPFEWPILNKLYLASLNGFLFKYLMRYAGVYDHSVFGSAEANAYVQLLKREDKGAGFLKLMGNFENTAAKQALYLRAIESLQGPKQFIWGKHDPALPIATYAHPAQQATGITTLHQLDGKHFLQEDCAADIARLISNMIKKADHS